MRKRKLAALCLVALLMLSGCASGGGSGAYNKALDVFATGDFAASAEAFAKLGDYANAATYAAYSQGMVYFEQARFADAEPYFAQTRGFMYGEQRYRLCHAYVLAEGGQYAEAMRLVADIRDFEDAEVYYQYYLGRDAENNARYGDALYAYELAGDCFDAAERLYNLRGQVYNRALECREQGGYQEAIDLFLQLGDYLNSADLAVECKAMLRDQQYQQAEALQAAGDLQPAYELFRALEGYRDAGSRAEELALLLGIPQQQDED